MKLSNFARLALSHARNHFAEEVYLHAGKDVTRPVTFYGLVNERCNVKCRYCEYWRLPKYKDEMSIEEWKRALTSVKDFVGTFSISFSGGEPFIKPGFLEIMEFCAQSKIHAGTTTNGSALTPKNAARYVASRPWNLNISVDAPVAEVHDYLRGWPGLFQKLSDGIKYVKEEQARQGIEFPIIIKPTVGKKNFRYMPEMVDWVKKVGATGMNMQPMDHWTPETYDELWINEDEHEDLRKVMDELLAMKRAGEPIINSELLLTMFLPHFREETAPKEVMPCRVGMRDFFIRTNGDIEVCFFYPPIGNIKEQSAREIWYGPKAEEIRRQTVECDRLCLFTCLSQKTLKDKVKMGLTILKHQGNKARPQEAPEEPAVAAAV